MKKGSCSMLKSTWNRETRKVKGSNMNMRQRRGHETERVLITRIEGPEIHRNLGEHNGSFYI